MSTSISIKSEIDSRVLLYPLMRCLVPLGNILIVSSNRMVSRLIDGEFDGEFRNFRILIDTEGATDDVLDMANVSPDEYTFVVYDNVGITEQDKLLIPIGHKVSEIFEGDMMLLGEDQNTHILRFGKAQAGMKGSKIDPNTGIKKTKEELAEERKAAAEAKKAAAAAKKVKTELSEEEMEEQIKSKFTIDKKDDVVKKLAKLPNITFPSFDDIELFESTRIFYQMDRNFIKFFYAVFKPYIGISEPNFMREVTRK